MKRSFTGFALAALLTVSLGAQQERIFSNSYKGKTPPEFKAKKADWLNWKNPETLKKLKGRVVWLEFGFLA